MTQALRRLDGVREGEHTMAAAHEDLTNAAPGIRWLP